MSDLFKNFTRFGFGFLFTVHVIFAANEKEDSKQEGERLFSLKVKQIFSSKCFACHGGDPRKIKGEFDLTTQEGLLKGGESEEPGVVPGKPEASPIVLSIERKNEDFLMPPKENDKLDPSQVEVIKRWVELGALWPDAKTQARYIDEERTKPVTSDGMLTKTSGGLSDEWTYRRYQPADLWAFQPVKKTRIP
ncbi:MAG TPA: c-type cytochrome domain-containing protein, partial [Verrucomicrobiota bacterium]|nr:c-type cytochrome domain-containing protein [Verrucomicrobiota bacterium]